MTVAKFKVGDRCRCLHHYAYRSKELFTIVSIATAPHEEYEHKFRYVYIVQYDDGVIDAIPVEKEVNRFQKAHMQRQRAQSQNRKTEET